MYNYTGVDICEYQFIMIIDQDLFNVFGEAFIKKKHFLIDIRQYFSLL